MSRQYKSGLIITGDASGAVKAANLTRNELQKLNTQADKNGQSMNRLASDTKRYQLTADNLNKTLATQAHKAVLWAAGFAGVSSVMGSLSTQLQVIDKIGKLSLRIGASTEALSAYSHVAELSGTNIQQLSLAWQRQTRRIAEAAAGYGEARGALDELNLSAADLNKLKPEQQFEAIAKALEGVKSEGDRLRLANKIFDSEGAAAALQIINQGTEAMGSMVKEAHQLGIVVDGEATRAVEQLNDSTTRLSAAFTGLTNNTAIWLGQNLTEHINTASDVVSGNVSVMDAYGSSIVIAGGLISSRLVPALHQKIATHLQSAKAMKLSATAALEGAKNDQLKASAALRSAEAERKLALHYIKVAQTQEARAAASTQLARATQVLTAAERNHAAATAQVTAAQVTYNRVASVTTRLTNGLSGAMGLLGGPAGVAILAATAMGTYAANIDEAKVKTQSFIGPIDQLALALRDLYRAGTGTQSDHIVDQMVNGLLKHSNLERMQGMLAKTASQINEIKASLASGALSWGAEGEAKRKLEQLETRLQALNIAYKKASAAAKPVADSIDGLGDSAEDTAAKTAGLNDAQLKLLKRWEDQIPVIDKLKLERSQLLAIDVKDEAQKKRIELAVANLNRRIAESTKQYQAKLTKSKTLLSQMTEELRIMKLSDKERFIANKLRSASVEEMKKQGDQLRILAGQLYDEQEALNQIKKEAKLAEDAADPFATAWEEAAKRIDESFAKAWEGAFDSFEDFSKSILGSLKTLLAELAHQALTKPILVRMGVAGGSSGPNIADPSGFSLQSIAGHANSLTSFFNPASQSATTLINETFGMGAGGMGPPEMLINPSSYAGQAVNSIAPGLAAYGFAQQFGTVGGIAGGFGSTAIAGGISGLASGAGFLSGAGGALASLGPLGWAAIGIGALLGGKKPSDKTQSMAYDLDTFESAYSGLTGKKFDQGNLDSSTIAGNSLSAFARHLENTTGNDFAGGLQFTSGGRDGYRFLYSPDGIDTTLSKDTDIGSRDKVIAGNDPKEILDAAAKFLAETAGIDIAAYESLSKEGETLIEMVNRLDLQFEVVRQTIDLTGGAIAALDAGGLDASDSIIAAAGGLDKFAAGAEAYYQSFYTEEERASRSFDQLTNQLSSLGIVLPETRDGFRLLIEGIDQLTEAGREQYGRLIAAANLADQHYDYIESQSSLQEDAEQAIRDNNARLAAEASQRAWEAQRKAADERYKLERQLVTQISSTLDSLKLSNLSPLTPQQRIAEAQAAYAAVLVKAERGDLTTGSELDSAAKAYLAEASSYYASSGSYLRIFGEVTQSLEDIRARIDPSFNAHGSHAKGLESVPFDGYRAVLHKKEMVLPEPVADVIRNAVGRGHQQALIEEVRALRKEVAELKTVTGVVGDLQLQEARSQTRAIKNSVKRQPMMGK